MNDISSIASAVMAMSQSQTQDQISLSLVKMQAQAQQALAEMIMQNAREVEALTHAASGGLIDLFA